MAYTLDIKTPFVQKVEVGGEMTARASFYGRKIRTSGKGNETGLYWSYGKKSWGRIGGGSVALGFPGSRLASDKLGDLNLYSSRRHLPKLPLLNGIDVTNEGTMGSLIKGTFSFTVYPEVSRSSMALGAIEGAYFVPGRDCSISFGWSTYASQPCASRFSFKGIIYNFNWSVNQDMSVSAQVSVVSAATLAVGAPGQQSTNTTTTSQYASAPNASGGTTANSGNTNTNQGSSGTFNPLDPKNIPIVGHDLASCIDEDMSVLNPVQSTSGTSGGTTQTPSGNPPSPEAIYGIQAWEVATGNGSSTYGLKYAAVGIPWQPDPPATDEVTKTDLSAGGSAGSAGSSGAAGSSGQITKPIVKKIWYISLQEIETFINKFLNTSALQTVMRVDITENITESKKYSYLKSAYPMEVLWDFAQPYSGADPINLAGKTGNASMNRTPAFLGGIWLSVDHVKDTWRKFFTEKSTDVGEKALTSFLNELVKRVNEACGNHWQLGATVVEKISSCGGPGPKIAVLSVEDFTYNPNEKGFRFEASGFRPMIKSVSISCKPPGPLATAAYTAARGGGGDSDVSVPGQKELNDATQALTDLETAISTAGVNTAWGDSYKAALVQNKKSQKGHWMTAALYPIDFSVTVDGISGFKFGDAVTTNLIPARYAGKMFFTVTKINHKVGPDTWETTLNTAARINSGV
jgi:hypothetical protein